MARMKRCDICGGSGHVHYIRTKPKTECRKIGYSSAHDSDVDVVSETEKCPQCNGNGMVADA